MKTIRTHVCAVLLTAASAFGGTFTADFATQDTSQFILNGAGTLSDTSPWAPFIATNRLILTVNQNNLSGAFSPVDFDGGAPIQSFIAKFKLQFGPGSGNAADGAALSFGPDIDQNSTSYNEVGAGGSAVAVSFHTYTSNGGPAVDVYLYGNRIGHVPIAKTDMVNSQLQDVIIELARNSTLNVTYRGQVVFTNLFLPNWGPTNGFFIISARTGGENEETDIANVSINTTLYTTAVAPTVTAGPQSVTVAEGSSASFSVGVDGTGPFTFQWTKNTTDILDATNQTLTLSPALFADNNASIAVRVTNPASSITSSPATLMVTKDTTAPTVVKAAADTTFTAILVTYSEPVSDTALTNSNYTLDQNATISAVDRVSPTTVKLTTSTLTQGVIYNLTINGVQDIATTPNTIAANTKLQIASPVFMAGTLLHQKYAGFNDTTGFNNDNLFNDPRFPSNPDRRDLLARWEYPRDGIGRDATADPARTYMDTIEGFFIPPTTGQYIFWTCGADRWSLYLSTDENPANKHLIAQVSGWTNPRNWVTGQQTDMTPARSDTFGSTEWPDGNTITLTNGQRYYMLQVHYDPSWAGADDFAATYKMPSDPDPKDGDAPKLTGSVIGFYFDPTGASINFTQQPQSVSVQEGNAASLSATATGTSLYGTNVLYQWQFAPKGSSSWTNIDNATSGSYKTPLLTLANDGTQFRVIASLAPISATSSVATVTVTTDTAPPIPTVGAMLDSVAGTVDVGVAFDEPVDNASASLMANYTVSPGTITSIQVYTNRFTTNSQNPLVTLVKHSVLLKVTGLSSNGTLTIQNVADVHGNAITSTNVPFTVDTKMKWGVVGGNEFGGTNAAVAVAPNGFDVYSDGVAEWTSYDEATFVYEQVTGDFDKKVRVEYQDGSSEWARAGLIVRDVTNFGVDRNGQTTNSLAGRYQKSFVTPVGATLTGPGTPGAQEWESNRRLDTGGQTTGAPITGANAIPQYPNAWCRLQRVGQTFNLFRSDDGVNWVKLGATTWGVDDASKTPMLATVYVGPEFAPEIGNITQVADQGTFLARFRDYGDFAAAFNPQLKIGVDATGKVTITWVTGILVSSPTVQGTYTPVPGAANPYVVTPSSGMTFYRVQQ